MKTAHYLAKKLTLLGIGLVIANVGHAAPLTLPDQPLFLSNSVQPNLIMAIDDSGSMDFEVLFRGNDGSAWWRSGSSGSCTTSVDNNSFVGCISNGSSDVPAAGQLNFNTNGNSSNTWKKFSYLFPNGCNSANDSYQRRLCDESDALNAVQHFAIPPLDAFAWARSPEFNAAYFDPSITYEPWPDGGGYTFSDSPPTAARFDPVFGAGSTINLTQDVAGTGNTATACSSLTNSVGTGYYFRVFTGMTIPEGTCIRVAGRSGWEEVRSGGCVVGQSNQCLTKRDSTNDTFTLSSGSRVAIRYFPATFYLKATTSLPAGFGYAATPQPVGVAPDGSTLLKYEIKPDNFSSTSAYNAAIQNFANWFTYYRKRHQALRAGLGKAFMDINNIRVAGFPINDNSANVTMRDLNDSTNRTALYTQFYRDWVRSGGTPNRAAVYNLVRNFKRTGSGAPVQYYCQKNFGMLFTDGFSNPPASGDGFYGIGNVDGTHGAPYQDSVSGTMADGVMDAYINNIRPDLTPTGRVSVPPGCSATDPDPRLDCNTNLHMNFFAVTLGTRGLQFDPDASPPQDPYVSPPTWPTTFPARHPNAVDDIWHATINGRGKLLNAGNPSELSTKLAEVLTTIIERSGSASSASVNSGAITENTRVYQARFNSTFWTGELSAYPISATGVVQTQVWEAGALLPEPNSRQIITLNSDGTTAVPFRWASLDATRRAELSTDPTLGQDILNYIRGDASREGINPTNFRVRPSKLGDIISSSPAYVGRPNYRYRDSLEASPYSAFVAAHSARTPMVYVGANDGMLHGFNAETGVEVFAYIPSPVFSRLKNLPARNYSHQYFVDGSPSVADAYIGGSWRTVLVGGLNKGGRGMFALDITNPSQLAVAEAAPNSVVMWEFTDADDADLGYTYSQATIARLHNGQWAAIFGNGYNSPSGTAVLYVVNLHTGALIRKFDTQMTPARAPTGVTWDNGLSSPAVVDIDGDRIQDYVYAGDLYGNLWKFDISSSDPTEWSIPYTDASSRPAPLFAARDGAGNAQPITVRPVVIRGPFGEGMVVLFGTGKYLENADRNITPERRQSFYGIVDRNTNTNGDLVTGRSALTRQQILQEVTTPAGRARITSNNMIGETSGWYIDLVSPSGYNGERQITNPTVRDGVVHFTTMIPNADPCGAGGRSWIMSMDALNGARPQIDTQFDVNRDGQITDADNVVVSGTPVHVSGLQPDDDGVELGILWDPAILTSTEPGGGEGGGGCIQYRVMPDSFGNMTQEAGPCGPGSTGRQSWRQIR